MVSEHLVVQWVSDLILFRFTAPSQERQDHLGVATIIVDSRIDFWQKEMIKSSN